MPVDVVLGRPEEERNEGESYDSFAGNLVNKLEAAFTVVREELRVAAERRKKQYDLRVREKNFPVGTSVWYYCPRRYQRRSPKWQKMYTGPFLVVKYISPVNYVIQRSKHSLPKVVHADKLRAWAGEPLPSWLKETPSEKVAADGEAVEVTQPKPNERNDVNGRSGQAESSESSDESDGQSEQADSPEEATGSPGEVTAPNGRPVRTRRPPDRYGIS